MNVYFFKRPIEDVLQRQLHQGVIFEDPVYKYCFLYQVSIKKNVSTKMNIERKSFTSLFDALQHARDKYFLWQVITIKIKPYFSEYLPQGTKPNVWEVPTKGAPPGVCFYKLVGETTKLIKDLDDYVNFWLAAHPTYNGLACNCRTFVEDVTQYAGTPLTGNWNNGDHGI